MLRVRSPRGQGSPPSHRRLQSGGGGGGMRSMSAVDLVAFGCGRLRPRGGDRRRGTARLLRATEMRLKTSGSDAGGSATGRGGCSAVEGEGGGGGALRCTECP